MGINEAAKWDKKGEEITIFIYFIIIPFPFFFFGVFFSSRDKQDGTPLHCLPPSKHTEKTEKKNSFLEYIFLFLFFFFGNNGFYDLGISRACAPCGDLEPAERMEFF